MVNSKSLQTVISLLSFCLLQKARHVPCNFNRTMQRDIFLIFFVFHLFLILRLDCSEIKRKQIQNLFIKIYKKTI
uniref:Uncharacterized protein n=1 Tax=Helianthus annuus TaxID=4232 RepID=A0A251SLJ8_HELAN